LSARARLVLVVTALALVVLALALGALFVGSAPVSARAVVDVLTGRAPTAVDEVV